MNRIEQAVLFAIDIATDNRHGYSQARRHSGIDEDCSTTVLDGLRSAGFNVGSASYTGNMLNPLIGIGFRDVAKSVNALTGKGLQRGDILLRPKTESRNGHTAFYIGDGKIVQAQSDYDGVMGDSSGNEIRIQNYYNSPFMYVLRHPEASTEVGTVYRTPYVTMFAEPSRYLGRKGKYPIGKAIAFNGKRYPKDELWLHDTAGYWIIGKYISGVDATRLPFM